MRIHNIIPQTRAEGPGLRFCIWVQGCSRCCPGCFNPETWAYEGGKEYPVEALLQWILTTPDIEGITLLGGEPMEQAQELSLLAKAVRLAGLSVLCFTGYTLEEIQNTGNADMHALLTQTDLLIDGPYVQAQRDLRRPWVGSSNQRYHFLTERYNIHDVENCRNRLEIRLDMDGKLILNGMVTKNMIDLLEITHLSGGNSSE